MRQNANCKATYAWSSPRLLIRIPLDGQAMLQVVWSALLLRGAACDDVTTTWLPEAATSCHVIGLSKAREHEH